MTSSDLWLSVPFVSKTSIKLCLPRDFYNHYPFLNRFGMILLWILSRLPKFNGYDAILVVVDRISKYAHFSLLKHPFTAKMVAALFVKDIVRLHGIPRTIVSD